MKLPAIRAYIGDWVYYVATMRFKDVSEYVKRVDNELHKSDLLKQMLTLDRVLTMKALHIILKLRRNVFLTR